MIDIFWPAFLLAVLLVYIHAIFGIEIIRRGVIFTDLAIGQIAAVGMAISIAFLDAKYQTPLVMTCAVFAALVIAWASKNIKNLEAFIGLLYAFGISSIMLILSKSAEGMEIFSQLSAADLLFACQDDLLKSLLVYVPISLVMFYIYPRTKGFFKEVTFFVMLALTVTFSVQVAGVLVVFALLIAPAYIGIVQKNLHPLVASWISGVLAIITAIVGSYSFDLPTGYSIIFVMVMVTLIFVVINEKKSLEGRE